MDQGGGGRVSEVCCFEHVADDALDGDGANGAPEEQLLDGAGAHSPQRRQQEKELSEPVWKNTKLSVWL